MFSACPHCQFLVARDPHSGAAPAACPRCGKAMATEDAARSPAPSLATLLHAARDRTETQAVEAEAVATRAIDEAAEVSDVVPAEPPAAPATVAGAQADTDGSKSESDDLAADDDAPVEPMPLADSVPMPVAEAPAPASTAAPAPARKANGPRFLHRARTTPVHTQRARLQWTIVTALSLLLCVQVVVADRTRLAMQAGWRPVVTALCAAFRCDVPTWREPAAFTMLSRDVRPLLDAPGTLQAQATFRNEARWAQAWPVILLTLKDADGRTLGARALRPADYLPEGETATAIGPGQSAQMAVRIREPSASVVAYSFDFR